MMAHESQDFSPAENQDANADDRLLSQRVQELTWALLDDYAAKDDVTLLENLLLSDDKARAAYLNCIQLHSDLMSHFAAPVSAQESRSSGRSKPTVLGFLNAPLPPLDVETPSRE
jgi:hypothetical protein